MKIYLFLLLSISSFRNQKVSGNETGVKGDGHVRGRDYDGQLGLQRGRVK
jgi:hypothetical protein